MQKTHHGVAPIDQSEVEIQCCGVVAVEAETQPLAADQILQRALGGKRFRARARETCTLRIFAVETMLGKPVDQGVHRSGFNHTMQRPVQFVGANVQLARRKVGDVALRRVADQGRVGIGRAQRFEQRLARLQERGASEAWAWREPGTGRGPSARSLARDRLRAMHVIRNAALGMAPSPFKTIGKPQRPGSQAPMSHRRGRAGDGKWLAGPCPLPAMKVAAPAQCLMMRPRGVEPAARMRRCFVAVWGFSA